MSNQTSTFVHLKDKIIELIYRDFDDSIDVDNLTSIDYSNLYGEAVTVPALINKIGLFKAEAESAYEEGKVELDVYEAETRKKYRKEAANNSGKVLIQEKPEQYLKLTEKALDELILLDKGWQIKKSNVAKRKKDLDFVEVLFWAIKSKDGKLNHLLPKTVPEDFEKEITEGVINGIMIKKHTKKHS